MNVFMLIFTAYAVAILMSANTLGSLPALAHHSFSMFDRDTQRVLTGTTRLRQQAEGIAFTANVEGAAGLKL